MGSKEQDQETSLVQKEPGVKEQEGPPSVKKAEEQASPRRRRSSLSPGLRLHGELGKQGDLE